MGAPQPTPQSRKLKATVTYTQATWARVGSRSNSKITFWIPGQKQHTGGSKLTSACMHAHFIEFHDCHLPNALNCMSCQHLTIRRIYIKTHILDSLEKCRHQVQLGLYFLKTVISEVGQPLIPSEHTPLPSAPQSSRLSAAPPTLKASIKGPLVPSRGHSSRAHADLQAMDCRTLHLAELLCAWIDRWMDR